MKRNLIRFAIAVGMIATIGCDFEIGEANQQELVEAKKYKVLSGPAGGIIAGASFSPDGKQVLTYSNVDYTARLWNAATGAISKTFQERGLSDAEFSPDGQTIALANLEGFVKLVASQTGKEIRTMTAQKAGSPDIGACTFSPNGKLVAAVAPNGYINIFDPSNGQLQRQITLPDKFTISAAFSPDSKMIGTVFGNVLQVYNVATGEQRLSVKDVTDTVVYYGAHQIAFSPDGIAIVAPAENNANVVDANTGRVLITLKGHRDWVVSATYSRDGKRIATASKDKTAKIWHAKTGNLLATLDAHHDIVLSAAFSPNGDRIVTASIDGTAIIWKLSQ